MRKSFESCLITIPPGTRRRAAGFTRHVAQLISRAQKRLSLSLHFLVDIVINKNTTGAEYARSRTLARRQPAPTAHYQYASGRFPYKLVVAATARRSLSMNSFRDCQRNMRAHFRPARYFRSAH